LKKKTIGAKTLNKTRFIIFITGLLSIFLALNYTSVIGILLIALTVYSGAFIIPILFGLLNINVNKERVNIAIISGGIIALYRENNINFRYGHSGQYINYFSICIKRFDFDNKREKKSPIKDL
jgi:SSS family solute:Na+ symporter